MGALLNRLDNFFKNQEPAKLQRVVGFAQPVKFSHEEFHKAIAADPYNQHHKLIYADWLEENHMPATAELIRRHVHNFEPFEDPGHSEQVGYHGFIHSYGPRPEAGALGIHLNSTDSDGPYATVVVHSLPAPLWMPDRHPIVSHDTKDIDLVKRIFDERVATGGTDWPFPRPLQYTQDAERLDRFAKHRKDFEEGRATAHLPALPEPVTTITDMSKHPEQLSANTIGLANPAKPKMSDTLYVPPAQGARMLQRLDKAIQMMRSGKPVKFSWDDMLRFHQHIDQNYKESFHKLVYADWLEEHGLPATAELIRLHEHRADPHAIHGWYDPYQAPVTHYLNGRAHDPYMQASAELHGGGAEYSHEYPPHIELTIHGRVEPAVDPEGSYAKEWTPIVRHKTSDLELARRVLDEHGANNTSHPDYKEVGISDLKPLDKLIAEKHAAVPEQMQRIGKPVKFMHKDFAYAMAKEPKDPNHKLIYADWLEENRFPATAHMIRLAHDRQDPQEVRISPWSGWPTDTETPGYMSEYHPDLRPAYSVGYSSLEGVGPYVKVHMYGRVKPEASGVPIIHHYTKDSESVRNMMDELGASPEALANHDKHTQSQADWYAKMKAESDAWNKEHPELLEPEPLQRQGVLYRMSRMFVPVKFSDVTAHNREGRYYYRAHPKGDIRRLLNEGIDSVNPGNTPGSYVDAPEMERWPDQEPEDSQSSRMYVSTSVWPHREDRVHVRIPASHIEDRLEGPDRLGDYYVDTGENEDNVLEPHQYDVHIGGRWTRADMADKIMQKHWQAMYHKPTGHYGNKFHTDDASEEPPGQMQRQGTLSRLERLFSATPIRFAEQPLRAKPLRSGLVELTQKIDPRDERQAGASPRFAPGKQAQAENSILHESIRKYGVPITDPLKRDAITRAYIPAIAHVLRTKPDHPAVQGYTNASQSPEKSIVRDTAPKQSVGLRSAADNLIGLVRTTHPWLQSYDAKRHTSDNPEEIPDPTPGFKPTFDYASWLNQQAENPAVRQALEPDFAPPTLPMAQDLPPIKPVRLPGELSRKPGRGGRLGTLEEQYASGASREGMIDALMKKFLLTPQQASRTVGNFLRRKASAKKLWRGFEELIRMRRG